MSSPSSPHMTGLVLGLLGMGCSHGASQPASQPSSPWPVAMLLRPLLVVTQQAEGSAGFILACARSTRNPATIISGKECAALLSGPIQLETIGKDGRQEVKVMEPTVHKGWPCRTDRADGWEW